MSMPFITSGTLWLLAAIACALVAAWLIRVGLARAREIDALRAQIARSTAELRELEREALRLQVERTRLLREHMQLLREDLADPADLTHPFADGSAQRDAAGTPGGTSA